MGVPTVAGEQYQHYRDLVDMFVKKMGMDQQTAEISAHNVFPDVKVPAQTPPGPSPDMEKSGRDSRAEMMKLVTDRLAERGYTRQTGIEQGKRYPAYSAQDSTALPYLQREAKRFPAPPSYVPPSVMAQRIAAIQAARSQLPPPDEVEIPPFLVSGPAPGGYRFADGR